MDTDNQYLRLLSTFHYVVGAIFAVIGFIPIIHLTLGIAMLEGLFDTDDGQPPPPEALGWMFVFIGTCLITMFWSVAACLMLAGRRLAQRRSYWFCFVVACAACAFSPFGTVLGVFTILVLARPSVKAQFGLPAGTRIPVAAGQI
jgi:tellurite resistance protein TehA-like permease